MHRLSFRILIVALVACFMTSFALGKSEKTTKLLCYYYDPNYPYVDSSKKALFKYIEDKQDLEGHLRGSFFIAGGDYDTLRDRCNSNIPPRSSLLKMRAMQRGEKYVISAREQARLDSFKRVIVFGDSLSEEGRVVQSLQKVRHPVKGAAMMGLARVLGCRIPEHFLDFGLKPYWNGMFSNGPMWPHYLSELLDNVAVLNLSFGGVTTGSRRCHMIHLHYLLKRHLKANPDRELISENLYLIWLGANNYFYPSGLPEPRKREARRAEAAAKAMFDLEKSVEILLGKGAGHVVLFTVPSPKKSPDWRSFYDPGDTLSETDTHKAEWQKSVSLHNEELRAKVEELQLQWGSRVSLFDAEAMFEAEEVGLKMDPDIMWKNEHANRHFSELIHVPGYFDAVHPTTKVHCLTAQRVVSHLQRLGLAALYPSFDCDERIDQLLVATSKT